MPRPTLVILCLLFGAAATIAIACGAACWSEVREPTSPVYDTYMPRACVRQEWLLETMAGSPSRPATAWVMVGLGWRYEVCGTARRDLTIFQQARFCAGWPLPAFEARSNDAVHITDPDFRAKARLPSCLQPALPMPHRLLGFETRNEPSLGRVLPLRPIPLGFAIDTLVLGGTPLLVICTPGWMRRWWRLRHGCCCSCGYCLRGLARCPECGTRAAPTARRQPPKSGAAPHSGHRWAPVARM